jgi:hypothetical protein
MDPAEATFGLSDEEKAINSETLSDLLWHEGYEADPRMTARVACAASVASVALSRLALARELSALRQEMKQQKADDGETAG